MDTVLLKIVKRPNPLVPIVEKEAYSDFIKYAFNTWKKDLKTGLKNVFTYKIYQFKNSRLSNI